MERITVEVAKATASDWRSANEPSRKKIASLIAKALKASKQKAKPTGKAIFAEASLNETSLAKDWLSPEDNRWDELLK